MSKRIKPGSPQIAVAYIRVSTEDQKLGPEAQRAAIESWAAHEGVRVVLWREDRLGGATPIDERPGLLEALAALREHGAGVFVVAKRDRIARDIAVAAGVERAVESAGARVVSAGGEGNGDSPADQFLRTIVDGAAQYERALIRARTKAALGIKKARGEKTGGGVRYGQRLKADGSHVLHEDGTRKCAPECAGCKNIEPDEREAPVVELAKTLRAKGLSLSAVATRLAEVGCLSRTGKPFATMQISRMISA